jgi:endonuclease YncB( thermonuclease family)
VSVSKHWKPGRKTIVLPPGARPSRIRREPVRLHGGSEPQKERKTLLTPREREMWGGVTGVLLFAAALAVVIVGIGAVTFFRDDPEAAARAARFGQCYNGGANCVIDGGAIYVQGTRVEIAGIEAPSIQNAQCDAERTRGIDAAVRLAELLNSGRVSVSGAFRDASGREVRKVAVNGEDVAGTMIDAGVAQKPGSETAGWCG